MAWTKWCHCLSAAMWDRVELQYERESKAGNQYATIDVAKTFFFSPLAAECGPQFCFRVELCSIHLEPTAQGLEVQPYLPVSLGLMQIALDQGEASEHLQYMDDITVWANSRRSIWGGGKNNPHHLENWFCHKTKATSKHLYKRCSSFY